MRNEILCITYCISDLGRPPSYTLWGVMHDNHMHYEHINCIIYVYMQYTTMISLGNAQLNAADHSIRISAGQGQLDEVHRFLGSRLDDAFERFGTPTHSVSFMSVGARNRGGKRCSHYHSGREVFLREFGVPVYVKRCADVTRREDSHDSRIQRLFGNEPPWADAPPKTKLHCPRVAHSFVILVLAINKLEEALRIECLRLGVIVRVIEY